MLSPQGRVIMVTGANRGIGNAVARCLHGKGYTLSLGARDVEALDTAVADFADARVVTHHFDAYDAISNAAWVAATTTQFGRLDGLVNITPASRAARASKTTTNTRSTPCGRSTSRRRCA